MSTQNTPPCEKTFQFPKIGDSQNIELLDQTPKKVSVHLDHERLMDCIHCGLCLPTCPTYAENGLEADSPRGRIYLMRALAEGRAEPTPTLVGHLDKCLGCRACETACPSGVQYGHLIEGARAHLFEHFERPIDQKIKNKMVELSFPYPARMELALLPVRVLRRAGILPFLRKIGVMKMLGQMGDMEGLLPPLPPMRKRLNFPVRWKALGEKQASVGMITGCVMQVMQSQVNEATARVLCKSGCDVAAPKTQNCCGALHAHIGDIEKAKEFAQRNIVAFEDWQKENGNLDAIVINAAGCGAALKEYPGWFKGDEKWENRSIDFAEKVKDVSEFLAQPNFKNRLQQKMKPDHNSSDKRSTPPTQAAPGAAISNGLDAREAMPNNAGATTLKAVNGAVHSSEENRLAATDSTSETASESLVDERAKTQKTKPKTRLVTYHDACHLAHGQGIRAEPRELLEMISQSGDFEIVALTEAEMCCGSAGSYNITQPEMAMQLLERKMKHIANTGASTVVTGNPGCAMQIMLGAKKFGPNVEVLHPVEVIDRATKG